MILCEPSAAEATLPASARTWWPIRGQRRSHHVLGKPPAPVRRRDRHSFGPPRTTVGAPGGSPPRARCHRLGDVHPGQTAASPHPAGARPPGGGRSASARRAGADGRAHPDRPGDARRARPPDLAARVARGCAGGPARPAAGEGTRDRRAAALDRPPGPGGVAHRDWGAPVRGGPGAGTASSTADPVRHRPSRRGDPTSRREHRLRDAGGARRRRTERTGTRCLSHRAGGTHQHRQTRQRHRDEVRVTGAPVTGLHVSVRNRKPLHSHAGPALPGSGAGLLGLQERVSLAGGTLVHGPDGSGDFVVDAELQW